MEWVPSSIPLSVTIAILVWDMCRWGLKRGFLRSGNIQGGFLRSRTNHDDSCMALNGAVGRVARLVLSARNWVGGAKELITTLPQGFSEGG